MECRHAQEFISAYLDQELDPASAMQMATHLDSCAACRAALEELRTLRAGVNSQATQYKAPEHLRHRIHATLDTERQRQRQQHTQQAPQAAGGSAARQPAGPSSWGRWAWINLAVAGLSTTAFAVTLALYLTQPPGISNADERLEQELVASHFRALMPDHLADVASTDQHTVKPWFAGKLDYSPPVIDLAQQGYPLIGGRLDYVDQRPVAALVYQHRKHIVNLYIWPTQQHNSNDAKASDIGAAPRAASRQGFQLLRWRQGGMAFSAVSDMNQQDLAEFSRQLRQRAEAGSP